MVYRLKVCSLILWVALLYRFVSDHQNFGQNVYELAMIFWVNFILTVFCVVGHLYPSLVKYFTLVLFLYRTATIYLMFKLIELG